jgi:hypothetical protein
VNAQAYRVTGNARGGDTTFFAVDGVIIASLRENTLRDEGGIVHVDALEQRLAWHRAKLTPVDAEVPNAHRADLLEYLTRGVREKPECETRLRNMVRAFERVSMHTGCETHR